ncbi:recyclin-1 [[Candida] anglica]|uniref:Recyclin-1 n=1 Tax=[Candida] anglica TaxID=148631 RepID=A0ABP0EH88_9ASCO
MAQVIWNSDIDVYNPQVMPVSVAENITRYLNVQDLISFARVSKNTYKTVHNPSLWVHKLKQLTCWEDAIIPERDFKPKEFLMENFNNPLTCLDTIVKLPKLARFQILKIYKCLQPYYGDLLSNQAYEKLRMFKDFRTPADQAKILQNLVRFNCIDYDERSREVTKEKINALFEMFENALLRELEIHYDIEDFPKTKSFVSILSSLGNDQTLIDFFLQKTIFDNDESGDFFNVQKLDVDSFFDENGQHLQTETLDQFVESLATIFNKEAHIIDLIFPQSIPMMYKVCEELISNQLMEVIMVLIDSAKKKSSHAYILLAPTLYTYLTTNFIKRLEPCDNIGPSYKQLVRELLDMSYESFAVEYVREEDQSFKAFSSEIILKWQNSLSEREQQTVQNILKNVRVETKNDFLSSFKKVFTINSNSNSNSNKSETVDDENYSEFEAKTKILSENIKSLNKIFSLEIAMDILNQAKITLHRLSSFKEFSIAAIRADIYSGMQDIFVSVIDSVGNEHVKPGFQKALEYLETYKPNELEGGLSAHNNFNATGDPLVLFSELINMADLIIQMIDIFYKEEMINTQIVKVENSILNPSLQHKKKFEGLVDNYVADGLNVGIDLLVGEIENVFDVYLLDSDYNPPMTSSVVLDGPTEASRRVVKILEENIDLLVGCTDKSIVEVFQKEIAERVFQTIVKTLKKRTISVTGAMNLISDLNLYHDFIVTHIRSNKRQIVPLYQSLKKVGSIYLISGQDSKSIGKLVSDLSKFNGIFNQEEIYEFVQRRSDWLQIKRDVEKVMYGLSLGDCVIM